MVSRTTVFLKVYSESIVFNRKAFDEKVDDPHLIFGIDRLVKRNREKMNLISVMSLDEFHIVKVRNQENPVKLRSPELSTLR